MNVSMLELGDICAAKPAKQIHAKMVIFLLIGQFFVGDEERRRRKISYPKLFPTALKEPTKGSDGSSVGWGMRITAEPFLFLQVLISSCSDTAKAPLPADLATSEAESDIPTVEAPTNPRYQVGE